MITPSKLQLIVDGECTQEMRAAILRDLDAEPQYWRTVALGLLEEQQWSKQVRAISNSTRQGGAIDLETSCPTSVQPLMGFHSPKSSAVSTKNVWLAALAASLLLAIGIYGGLFLTRNPSAVDGPGVGAVTSHSESPRFTSNDWTPPGSDLGMKLVVTGPNLKTSEFPVYDMKDTDPTLVWAKENDELDRMNERLRKRGFELEVMPEYYTNTLNDGRKLIVPVKNVGLKPYGL